MLLLIIFSFIAGIVTVLSPCILPVLPIVLSGSVTGGKKRPFGIVTGFILSFTFFTLFLSTIVQATGISADLLRTFSIVIIGTFGVFLIFPQAQGIFEKLFQSLAKFTPQQTGDGFGSGLVVGMGLGLLWTPCVGPILASIISLALSGTVTGSAVLITLAYALGTSLPMIAIIYGGRNLLNGVPGLLRHTAHIQRGFGVVMILTAFAIFMNWDRQFQTWILTKFPSYGTGLTQFEEIDIVREQLDRLRPKDMQFEKENMGRPLFEMQSSGTAKLPVLGTAPELIPGGEWFNTEPLTLAQLQSEEKVVLIDFWTYSCINCIRTLPYLKDWHEKYAEQGLVIVGVHAPEFEFEKDADNVAEAIEDFELTYPVVQDNDFATWRAYQNRYWPAKYLIDKQGNVRYTHFGEGKYTETENAIRELLDETPLSEQEDEPLSRRRQTPETYLGYLRAQSYVQGEQLRPDATVELTSAGILPEDSVELDGSWYLAEEYVMTRSDKAQLNLNFLASQVFLVLDTNDGPKEARVLLDGEPLPEKYWTPDMDENGVIIIEEARKYDILNLGEDYGRHRVTIEFEEGVQAFAFTFGS